MSSGVEIMLVGILVTGGGVLAAVFCYETFKEPRVAAVMIGLPLFIYTVGFVTIKLFGG